MKSFVLNSFMKEADGKVPATKQFKKYLKKYHLQLKNEI